MGPRNLDAKSEVGDTQYRHQCVQAMCMVKTDGCTGLKTPPLNSWVKLTIAFQRIDQEQGTASMSEQMLSLNEKENVLLSYSKREKAESNETFPMAIGPEGR